MSACRLRKPALPRDVFSWVCGQQVKVKNTFLDVRPEHSSSNESTLTAQAMTCPEFTRCSEALSNSSSSHGSHGAGPESLPPDVELPSPLLTLSTLGEAWQPDPAGGCMGPVVEPLCSQDVNLHLAMHQELLTAIQRMPSLPFTDMVLGSQASIELPLLPLLPEVAGSPVLSTCPGQWEAGYGPWQPEPGAVEPAIGDSDKASPLSASPRRVHVEGLTTNGSGDAATVKMKPAKKHNPANKIWCHFFIDPMIRRNGFDVNKKLIGHGGSNTKRIYEETGAKIRLRGRGSGHIEGRGEAPVPLMLAVTSDLSNQDNFLVSMQQSAKLLDRVTGRYPEFCKVYGIPPPTTALFWIGELSPEALSCWSWTTDGRVQIGKVAVFIAADVSSLAKPTAKPRGNEPP